MPLTQPTPATRSSSAPARTRKGRARPAARRSRSRRASPSCGAGADLVTISPKQTSDLRIAESSPDLRNGKGVIISAKGDPNSPITVQISGVTVDANGVYATAGIVFLDAQGGVSRSLVTGLDVDESANGYTVPGGFRNNAYGIGVAAETRVRPPASGNQQPIAPRTITIDHTRIEKYNAVGVLIDAATTDYSPAAPPAPLNASGVPIQAILIGDQIAGRNSCQHYNDFTAGTPPVIVGNCQASGGGSPIPPPLPLTTGPLFGQDGVRVTAGASVQMSDTTISSNFVHGQGAPVASVFAPTPNNDPYSLGNHAENNANLRLGAGVRLVGAAASSITKSNIVDNAFGVLNTAADGVTNNSARPVQAQDNWWAVRTGALTLPTPGPAVWPSVAAPSPTTYNPPIPENPVNGNLVANAACPAGVSDSDSVRFCPYRSSTQSDQLGGEYPIADAPIAMSDPTTCASGMQLDPNIPTYDGFFNTVLGGPATGNGLSSGSAKKTAQLMAYVQAVNDAIASNPGTTGQRVATKIYSAGTSVLGVPMSIIVVGTPDNIANLDAGRNDGAFWRGVISGATPESTALSQVGIRPAFGWITGTPHGNEPAGGEASVKELYDLAARMDCANAQRLAEHGRVHPAGERARQPRPQRAHDRLVVRPEPRPGHDPDARERPAVRQRRPVSGPVLHRRAPADVRLLLPTERGRCAARDLPLRARPDQRRDRPEHPGALQRSVGAVPQLQHVRPVRPRIRRHRARAADGRRGNDVREGEQRELRQAGLRPLPGDRRDRERGRGREDASHDRLGAAVGRGGRPGLRLRPPGQHAGEPAGDRPARHRPGHGRPEPEHERLRLLLPAGRALGRRRHDDQGPATGGRERLPPDGPAHDRRRAPVRQLRHPRRSRAGRRRL